MKNKKVIIVCDNNFIQKIIYNSNVYYIGIERGCLFLLKNKIIPNLVIGDFDSLTKKEFDFIKAKVNNIKIFPTSKDYTDLYLAIEYVYEHKISEKIDVYLPNNRIDMDFTNLFFISKKNIKIFSNNYIMFSLKKGNNIISYDKYGLYDYISCFPLKKSKITISNFKYSAKKLVLERFSPIAISNEFIQKKDGKIIVHKGEIIIILQKNKTFI